MSEERKTFCTECGTENNGGSKFCCNCGSKLEQAAPVAAEAPVVEEVKAEASPYTTPYTAGVAVETTPVAEPVFETAAPVFETAAPVAEEIQIDYSQDTGSFSGNTYTSQPQYYTAEPVAEKKGNKGFAIASLVCGILSIICCCFSCFSLVLAIAAIGLGIVTLACKYDGKGMAVAGIVMGGLGVTMFIAVLAIGASDGYTEFMDELMNELY